MWHEVGRMVKEATERDFEDPDLEFSCSDWVRQSIEQKTPSASPNIWLSTFQYKTEVLLLRKPLWFNYS
jgi:hypothetical protein